MSSTLTESAANLCVHKHFNALGCIHIFAGIAYCPVEGLHDSCQLAIFGLRNSTSVAWTSAPATAFLGRMKVHPTGFAGWASPNPRFSSCPHRVAPKTLKPEIG